MVSRRVRILVAKILIEDPIFPPVNLNEILEGIELILPFEYQKNILKLFIPQISQKNPRLDREIWKQIKRDKDNDQFLSILAGITHMKVKEYIKARDDFNSLLKKDPKFVLNSFIVIKLLKCLKRARLFNELLNNIDSYSSLLRQEHRFIALGYKALCYEIVGNKPEALNCYREISTINCRAKNACLIWLEVEDFENQKGLCKKIDNIIKNFNEKGQNFKDFLLIKAFLLYKKGKFDKCAGILTQILAKNKRAKICSSLLAKVLNLQGELRKSAKFYLMALNYSKKSPEIWHNLYIIYNKCQNGLSGGLKERAKKLDNGDLRLLNDSKELIDVHINFANFCEDSAEVSAFEQFTAENYLYYEQSEESDANLLCELKMSEYKADLKKKFNTAKY